MGESVNSNVLTKLRTVQSELKAPKGQLNKFGNYNFRNAEDILEAVKPLLNKYGLTLVVTDSIVLVGDRYYVKATALVVDEEGNSQEANGYAREAEEQKGFDSSQITGSASSYARKYALNGLFAIDDSKDADSNEHKTVSETRTATTSNDKPESPSDVLARAKKKINKTLIEEGYKTPEAKTNYVTAVLGHSTIDSLDEANEVMDALEMDAATKDKGKE